jgi:hypothetical protein
MGITFRFRVNALSNQPNMNLYSFANGKKNFSLKNKKVS